MKANEIIGHFLSRADWVDGKRTVDRVIVGDPDADFDRCIVTWMPSMRALRHVAARGVHLLMCHEPTFWNHRDDPPTPDDAMSMEKLTYIKDHGITIIRNHDCWDRWPDVGIPWAWAQFLGLGDRPTKVSSDGYQHRYDITPLTLDELARRVAERCATLGEPLVQVTGDLQQSVSRIGVGTGCGCDIPAYRQMDCDVSIVCDDGSCYWSGIQKAEDFGHGVIRVNHGTSEEPGMVALTKYINEHVDGLQAEHFPHGSTFRLIGHADLYRSPGG
jgi:putative NIF3 family GTP cyclohydrolase 1 type 2